MELHDSATYAWEMFIVKLWIYSLEAYLAIKETKQHGKNKALQIKVYLY